MFHLVLSESAYSSVTIFTSTSNWSSSQVIVEDNEGSREGDTVGRELDIELGGGIILSCWTVTIFHT